MSTLSHTPSGGGISARQVRQIEEENQARLSHVNVADAERWASAVGGGLMIAYGLKRGTLGGLALAAAGGALLYRGYTGQCPVYRALGHETSGGRSGKTAVGSHHGTLAKATLTVDRPAEELYRYWSDVANLKSFMNHVESISPLDDTHSRWVIRGPFGMKLQWDAELLTANPPQVLSWKSVEGGDLNTAWAVRFDPAPGDRGTEVTLEVNYEMPGGLLGQAVSKYLGQDPEWIVRDHLRRFKQLMETGEIATNGSQVAPA